MRRAPNEWKRRGAIFVSLIAAALVCAIPELTAPRAEAQAATADWVAGPSMATGRNSAAAVVLDAAQCRGPLAPAWCGKVLVAGGNGANGALKSAELYDPFRRLWSPAGDMSAARGWPIAVLLHSGRVVVVSNGARVADIYDPASGTWSTTGEMVTQRTSRQAHRPTATVLGDGRVLVAGGMDPRTQSTAASEIYDAGTNRWSRTADMITARQDHTAVLLQSGSVLVVGGEHTISGDDPPGTDPAGESAEVWSPATGTWSAVKAPPYVWYQLQSVLLADGRVLVMQGFGTSDVPSKSGQNNSTMVYNPSDNSWTQGILPDQGDLVILLRLPDDRIIAVPDAYGGVTQVFDPVTNAWRSFDRGVGDNWAFANAVLLPCQATGGRVLRLGGGLLASAGEPPGASDPSPATGFFIRVPTVQQVTPALASIAGGENVVIKGLGLAPKGQGTVRVRFGGTEVAGSANADGTQVTVKAPAVTAEGPVDLDVLVEGVKAQRCTTIPFLYVAPPSIDRVSPESALATGGERVTISGKGLAGAVLSVDGQTISGATFGATEMSFGTPTHDPGTATLTITNPVGSASASFKYVPALSGLSPKIGASAGDADVTVTGKGLRSAKRVRFGDKAVEVMSKTDTEVKVKSPAHDPGKVLVSVDTDVGTSAPSQAGANQYEFVTPPAAGTGGQNNPGGTGGGLLGGGPNSGPTGAGGNPTGGGNTGAGGTGSAENPGGGAGVGGAGGGAAQAPAGGASPAAPPPAGAPPAPIGNGPATAALPTNSPVPISPAAGIPSVSPAAANAAPAPVPPPALPTAPAASSAASPQSPLLNGLPGAAPPSATPAEGAPRYAMVGPSSTDPLPAFQAIGGVVVLLVGMMLFGCLWTAFNESPVAAADDMRPQYAH